MFAKLPQCASRTENLTIPEGGGEENQRCDSGSGTFWPGRIQIRNICTGSGSDLFDKKILNNFLKFFFLICLRLQTSFL